MIPAKSARLALLIVMAAFECLPSGVVAQAESFDKPVRKAVVDLGPSPALTPNSREHIQLYCSYYPGFMVKQLDDPGEKGTQWVTITTALNGLFPPCRTSHGLKERFLDNEGWWFGGVKGSLLFLEAADGEDGGMPFRILDWRGRRVIFEDSAALPYYGGHGFEFVRNSGGGISLRYLRVVRGGCSIPKGGQSCWNEFKEKFGLLSSMAPTCTGYVGEQPDQPIPLEDVETPSTLQYPAEVELSPRPSIHAVPGPMKCRPQE
jgi:hypothetical protein